MTQDELTQKLLLVAKDIPNVLDPDIDALVALKQINITWGK